MAQLAYLCEGEDAATAREVGDVDVALSVSLFGDDEGSLEQMAEDVRCAGMSLRATKPLASLLETGGGVLGDVVLVDCPSIDGARLAALVRLDERVARAGAQLVVSTSREALEDVFGCLERSRPQILVAAGRAERLLALGGALARMSGHRLRELDERERVTLVRLTEEVGRLAEKLDRLSGREPLADAGDPAFSLASPAAGYRHSDNERDLVRKPRAPLPDPRLVKRILRQRQLRARYFDRELFADPAWDMLLDLTAARAEHRRVSVTSLCIASGVPPTTALRWIGQMVDAGLLERVQDETDRRRVFIALSDKTADAMARYFDELGKDAARMV